MNTTARTLAFAGLVGPVWFTSLVALHAAATAAV